MVKRDLYQWAKFLRYWLASSKNFQKNITTLNALKNTQYLSYVGSVVEFCTDQHTQKSVIWFYKWNHYHHNCGTLWSRRIYKYKCNYLEIQIHNKNVQWSSSPSQVGITVWSIVGRQSGSGGISFGLQRLLHLLILILIPLHGGKSENSIRVLPLFNFTKFRKILILFWLQRLLYMFILILWHFLQMGKFKNIRKWVHAKDRGNFWCWFFYWSTVEF